MLRPLRSWERAPDGGAPRRYTTPRCSLPLRRRLRRAPATGTEASIIAAHVEVRAVSRFRRWFRRHCPAASAREPAPASRGRIHHGPEGCRSRCGYGAWSWRTSWQARQEARAWRAARTSAVQRPPCPCAPERSRRALWLIPPETAALVK